MAAAAFRTAASALALAGCTSVAVDQRTFAGTRWHVTAINARATPETGDYRMEFGNGRISGRFGCNGWGGAYSTAGERLITSNVASTLMGCAEPAASFESQGLAILQQPMRWTWAGGTRLTLSNRAGAIALVRVP